MKNKKILLIAGLLMVIAVAFYIIPKSTSKYYQKITKQIRISISDPEYSIVFIGGDGATGSMSPINCVYNEECTLPDNSFTKTGYEFLGWAIEEDGEVLYEDGAIVSDLAITGYVNLYAKWIGILNVTVSDYIGLYDGQPHTFTINADGGTVRYGATQGNYITTTKPSVTEVGSYLTYYQVTKEGYRTVEGVARIFIGAVSVDDTSYYTTLKAAFDAVSSSSSFKQVKVYKDLEEQAFTIGSDAFYAVDLMGHTVSLSANGTTPNQFIVNNGRGTFRNGTIESSTSGIRNNNLLNLYGVNIDSTGTTISNSGILALGEDTVVSGTSSEYPTINNTSSAHLFINEATVTSESLNALLNSGETTINDDALLETTHNSTYPTVANNDGTLIMNGGTISGTGRALYVLGDNATTTIDGGEISSVNSEAIYIVGGVTTIDNAANISSTTTGVVHAIYAENGAELNVDGGTIHGSYGGIYYNDGATGTLSGGDISGTTYASVSVMGGASISVTGANITNNVGTGVACVDSNSSVTISGGTISTHDNAFYNNQCNSTVSGGTLTSSNTNAIFNGAGTLTFTGTALATSNSSASPAIGVKGGTFVMTGGTAQAKTGGVIIKENASANISSGLIKTLNGGNGEYSALENSGTTTITGTVSIETDKYSNTVYNNPSGHMSIEGGSITNNSSHTVANYGELSVSDGAITNTASEIYAAILNHGTLSVNGGNLSSTNGNVVWNHDNGIATIKAGANISSSANANTIHNNPTATLYIEGGTIDNNMTNTIYNRQGTMYVSGGTIKNTAASAHVAITSNGTLTITGGTMTSSVGRVLYNDGVATISGGSYDALNNDFIDNEGIMTIQSGLNISTDRAYNLLVNGETATVYYNGGSLTGSGSNVVANHGEMNINGGTIYSSSTDNYAAIVNAGTLNVNDGILKGNRGNGLWNLEGFEATISGGTLLSETGTALYNDGILTIDDGTFTGGGRAVLNDDTATVTINGGTLRAHENEIVTNYGIAVISGTPDISSSEDFYSVVNKGNAQMTISGGTITNSAFAPVLNQGELNVTGGTIYSSSEGDYYAINNQGNLTVSNGILKGEGGSGLYNKGNGVATITGGTVSSSASEALYNEGTVYIEGGSIETISTASIYNRGTLEMSGGTVTSEGTTLRNYGAATVSGGTLTAGANVFLHYGTSATIGGTAHLIGDNDEYPAVVAQDGTLVNITGGTIEAGGYGLWVKTGGSGDVSGGTITSTTSNGIRNAGSLTISGGTITSETSPGLYNAGTALMSGGTITGTGSGATYQADGTFNMSGGTVTTSTTNVLSVHGGTVTIGGTAHIISDHASYPAVVANDGTQVNVTGGTIDSSSYALWIKTGATGEISGGTLTSATNSGLYIEGTTTMTGGTVTSASSSCARIYGTFNISGGTIQSTGSNAMNINSGTVTISGTAHIISGNAGYPTVVAQDGTHVNVSGGTIEGPSYGLWVKAGATGEITGGTITSSNSYGTLNAGTLTVSGGTITSETNPGLSNTGATTMTGGTIISTGGVGFHLSSGSFNMSGGTIRSTVSNGLYVTTGTMELSGTALIESTSSGTHPAYYIAGGTHNIHGGTVQGPSGLYVGSGSQIMIEIYPGSVFKASRGNPTTFGNGSYIIQGDISTTTSDGWTITTIT